MPAHSSHMLQPLDVGCFSALKRAYSKEIEDLMRVSVTHITKEDFFAAFHIAHNKAMTPTNARSGFRATGILPFNPSCVLAQLNLQLRTPSPPVLPVNQPPWNPKTPNNPIEMQSQTEYIQNRIIQHQNSSPTPILDSISQLAKSATLIMHEVTLIRNELNQLQKANTRLSRRRKAPKKRLQDSGSLTITEARSIEAQRDINTQIQAEIQSSNRTTRQGTTITRHCTACGNTGHNTRTCKVK